MKKDNKSLKIILAQPRGFCAGVERAIEIVEKALQIYGPPVYVRHEIVHNKRVVNNLSSKGAIFVQELDQIPEGAVTVFSAHGVAQRVEDTARFRNLPVLELFQSTSALLPAPGRTTKFMSVFAAIVIVSAKS